MSEFVIVEPRGKTVEIQLARPEKRNAITEDMYSALATALEEADKETDVAVALLSAAGAHFCAGNDLQDFVAIATSGHAHRASSAGRFLVALSSFTKPLIAAVQGNAVGVGTTTLLHCDLVYCAADARFSTPFAALGLTLEGASSAMLPAVMGHARAYAMLALGQVLDAQAALAAGLVNAVVQDGAVLDQARASAAILAERPRQALAITKRLMRGDRQSIWDLMVTEGEHFYSQTKSAEAQAAFERFFANRGAGA
jgi:enoyl-CoA hydratase/carnithine racemase